MVDDVREAVGEGLEVGWGGGKGGPEDYGVDVLVGRLVETRDDVWVWVETNLAL